MHVIPTKWRRYRDHIYVTSRHPMYIEEVVPKKRSELETNEIRLSRK